MTTLPDNIDVLVVGAGLFGSIIGKHLARQGRQVTIVDAEYSHSGSKPAACLMKPSWLSRMSKEQQAQSMSVLDSLYGVHEIEAHIGMRTTIYWVPPGGILKPDRYIKQRVMGVGSDHNGAPWFSVARPGSDHHEKRSAGLIIVATGVRPIMGVEVPGLSALAGVAFTWPCDPNRESRASIRVWAPYKQLVSLPNRYPGEIWTSDGTSLKPTSLTEKRIAESRRRCGQFIGRWEEDDSVEWVPPTELIGYRPAIRGLKTPCYLEQPLPNIWVANAGAKNGTAAAGWAAYKLAEATN